MSGKIGEDNIKRYQRHEQGGPTGITSDVDNPHSSPANVLRQDSGDVSVNPDESPDNDDNNGNDSNGNDESTTARHAATPTQSSKTIRMKGWLLAPRQEAWRRRACRFRQPVTSTRGAHLQREGVRPTTAIVLSTCARSGIFLPFGDLTSRCCMNLVVSRRCRAGLGSGRGEKAGRRRR